MKTFITEHALQSELYSYFQNRGSYYDNELGKEVEFELWKNEDKEELVNYRNLISELLTPLDDVIKELSLNSNFIKGVSIKSTAGDYQSILKYFIKNWLFRFVSSYEVLCHLVANCFEMVDPKEQFNRKKFSELSMPTKIKVPMVKIEALIESSSSLFNEDLNQKKNIQKHQGKFDYNNSTSLLLLDFKVSFKRVKNDVDTEIEYGLIRNKILNEIQNKDKDLVNLIQQVLDSLYPVVKERLKNKLEFNNL